MPLRVGHTGLEVTRFNHSHLHFKVGELPPAWQTCRRARTSEILEGKIQKNKETQYKPSMQQQWKRLESLESWEGQQIADESYDGGLASLWGFHISHTKAY